MSISYCVTSRAPPTSRQPTFRGRSLQQPQNGLRAHRKPRSTALSGDPATLSTDCTVCRRRDRPPCGDRWRGHRTQHRRHRYSGPPNQAKQTLISKSRLPASDTVPQADPRAAMISVGTSDAHHVPDAVRLAGHPTDPRRPTSKGRDNSRSVCSGDAWGEHSE